MTHERQFYIDGAWVEPADARLLDVIDPSTEESHTQILPYETEVEVVELANDTIYGLAAYVQSSDLEHARKVAAQLRAGNVHVNYPATDTAAPFGGYKQSGNGREYGRWGMEEFLETKAVIRFKAT